jgi:hypothetical protein
VTDDTTDMPSSTFTDAWTREQGEWQKLIFTMVDSAARDEQFLINLGNAMRGSLLTGKPYPTSSPAPEAAAHDEIVFALRRLEGQLNELVTAVETLVDHAANAAGEPR